MSGNWTLFAAVVAAATGIWSVYESWATRKETSAPRPVRTIFTFTCFFEEHFGGHPESDEPTSHEQITRYRLSVVNDGTRPVRILEMGHERQDRAYRSGRGVRLNGSYWDVVIAAGAPVTLEPGAELREEFLVHEFVDPNDLPQIGRGFLDVAGQARVYLDPSADD